MLHSPRPIKATNGQIFPSFTSTVNTDKNNENLRKQETTKLVINKQFQNKCEVIMFFYFFLKMKCLQGCICLKKKYKNSNIMKY